MRQESRSGSGGGSMKLHALHGGGERATMATFDPADPQCGEKVIIPYFFYVVEHPLGNVLFDTGAHPSLGKQPHDRLGDLADSYEILMDERDDVVSQLAALQMGPKDIDHVVLSHLHYDHAGGIEFFPNATFYVQAAELPFAYWPPVYQRGIYVKKDFDHPVRWKEIKGEHDIFRDGSVMLFPTPGHTPGHQCMLVKLNNQSVILVGDAAYLPGKMRDRLLPAIMWSPDALVSSWEVIEDMQERHNALLLFTHDLDWLGKTRVGPTEWYE